ncbi:MAG: RloB domain-containing protein [Syntrophomonadaceae bacterium]|nr:RloB domain-containing protein [Syntrophomonadaceae bacterium]
MARRKYGRGPRSYGTRPLEIREKKPRILIACEGEKTEPNYFRAFRPANVVVHGLGMNTFSLVAEAIRIRDDDPYGFDQVWCVFDRDDFTADNFNRALQLARNNDIKVAYSNEAFELWYVLHFDYMDVGIARHQYIEILKDRLGGYKKNDPTMYDQLVDCQRNAIFNATRLLDQYNPVNPVQDNPSTTVHNLVIELNKWKS